MLNIGAIADGLRREENGLWCADLSVAISYPEGRSDFCFGVERSSFWFLHRNRCIQEAASTFLDPGASLFDIGGGNGFVAAGLAGCGFDVWLVEPSADGLADARTRGRDGQPARAAHVDCPYPS